MEILDAIMQFPWVRQRSNIFMRAKVLVVFLRDHSDVVAVCAISRIFNILALFVREESRGRGVGGRILERTVREGREQGLRFILLSAYTDNFPALRLYSKIGFKKTLGFEELGYIVMTLPLSFWGEILHGFLNRSGEAMPEPFLIGVAKLAERVLRKSVA